MPEIPAYCTEAEEWVWKKVAAGDPADLNTRGPDPKNLDPLTEEGWGEDRRLTVKFLQTILTQDAFVEATPYSGVRILGALIDDAPLNLEHARLPHLFWLEKSRILVEVECRNLRVDGVFSLEQSFVSGAVQLHAANIREVISLSGATFEGNVILNGATVDGAVFLRNGAVFKGGLDLVSAKIGSNLEMAGSSFEGDVILDGATVDGSAFLRGGAVFKGELDLGFAKIGANLNMNGSTFEGDVNLNSATVDGSADLRNGAVFKGGLSWMWAKIGTNLNMAGSTFEGNVILDGTSVGGAAFLRNGAVFKGGLSWVWAKIGTNLDMAGSTFEGDVNLKGCTVAGDFLLAPSESASARWGDSASLILRNADVGALQDWWRDKRENAWPKRYELEGFTYDRLGSISWGKESDMLDRPATSYIQWLSGDPGSSPQPYEHLARCFHDAGEVQKGTDVLYAARERRRCKAWSRTDDRGMPKKREWLRAFGLLSLRMTIGYGLGNGYFRVIWWVGGLTLIGTLVLLFFGRDLPPWPHLSFASLDQLLPIISLDKAHDALIFGDPSAKPPVKQQEYGVRVYFYLHKILGWVLGSFLVAGLAGLTQRN